MPADHLDLTPGELDVTGIVGDDCIMYLDFSISLSSYTFFGYVETSSSPFQQREDLTITPINLSIGQLAAFLSSTATTAIGPISKKPWCFGWTTNGGVVRTVLKGNLSLNRRL